MTHICDDRTDPNVRERELCQLRSLPALRIWDSNYGPSTEAFANFRETICGAFMPWTPEVVGSDFEGRVESISLENGVVGRVRMSPIIARKTRSNIANSEDECIHGNYILAGELKIEQGDKTNFARRGDLILYRSFSPVTLTVSPRSFYDNLAFTIPLHRFTASDDAENKFCNALLSKNMMTSMVKNILIMISKNLHSASSEELSALFDACIALLPLSVECTARKVMKPDIPTVRNYMLQQVIDFIDERLSDPNLSSRLIAEKLGISGRYIHKLLADYGATFSSYVTAERLERVRSDLVGLGYAVPISVVAYRWGFSDLSTFNRMFKNRFGCNPSYFRRHSEA